VHVINVDGSMPGVLGGVSGKVYKEVVKTPNARRRLITASPEDAAHDEGWPDLDGLAAVEVTSEDKDYPVESALAAAEVRGWRAADSGTHPANRRSAPKSPVFNIRDGIEVLLDDLLSPRQSVAAAHGEIIADRASVQHSQGWE
jgi:hypothetical protein